MSFFLNGKISNLKQDPLLQKVIRSSAHLFTNNSISLILGALVGPLAIRVLGPADFGLIILVMVYVSTMNSLFSFRMSELVVRYGGEYLEKADRQKASALIKAAGLGEALVSIMAFLVVVLSAGWASESIAKTSGSAWMFSVFAIGLLANFNAETSIGILQVTDKIRTQGTINLIQSTATFAVIAAAFFWHGSLPTILAGYLLGKVVLGLGLFLSAQRELLRVLGSGWWRTPINVLVPYRELVRFAFSSNISATIIKVFRESELLWVGFFLTTTAVAYYKVAYALVSFLSVPTDPLIAATYPEINRLIVQKLWPKLREFLRRITTLAFAFNSAIGVGFILLGRWALILYGGDERFGSAYPALIILLAGLLFNYIFFWNRPLLLSLGLPTFPVKTTLVIGLMKIALAFVLVPRFGYTAAAALLSFYYVVTVGVMAWRGIRETRAREATNIPASGVPD